MVGDVAKYALHDDDDDSSDVVNINALEVDFIFVLLSSLIITSQRVEIREEDICSKVRRFIVLFPFVLSQRYVNNIYSQ